MIYRFGRFQVDEEEFRLSADGTPVPLEPKSLQVLLYLLRNCGHLIRKNEILDNVWNDANVTESALTRSIGLVRRALDDSSRQPRFIETIPTVGFRFLAEVTSVDPKRAPAAVIVSPQPPPPPAPPANHPRGWPTTGLLATICAVALLLWLVKLRSVSATPIRSLAVMPLQSLSNDSDQEYLAAGITEELITDLGYARSLRLLSRASTLRYKDSRLSVPQLAEQLQVDAIVEGTVLRSNRTIRITIRLTAAKPERQIWAASFERDTEDPITLQNQIAAEAAAQIRTQLAPEEKTRLSLKGRVEPEAYDEYLRARFFLDQETGQTEKAIPHLERAINVDPHFAAAYALLGEAWSLQGVWGGMNNRQTSAKALHYSQQAVSLDPDSSEAFAALGHALMQAHRWNEGEIALRRAAALNPNNPYAREYLAVLLVQKGRIDDSLRISRDVAAADPVSADFQRQYADMLYRARRYDDAIAQCQRVLELDANHKATYTTLANAYLEKGQYADAEAAFTKGDLMNAGVQAWLYARAGNRASAQKILEANPSLVNVHSAVARYLLGDRVIALSQLDDLTNGKWAVKTYHLLNDPTFDAMRSDPGFTAIVRKSGLLDN